MKIKTSGTDGVSSLSWRYSNKLFGVVWQWAYSKWQVHHWQRHADREVLNLGWANMKWEILERDRSLFWLRGAHWDTEERSCVGFWVQGGWFKPCSSQLFVQHKIIKYLGNMNQKHTKITNKVLFITKYCSLHAEKLTSLMLKMFSSRTQFMTWCAFIVHFQLYLFSWNIIHSEVWLFTFALEYVYKRKYNMYMF